MLNVKEKSDYKVLEGFKKKRSVIELRGEQESFFWGGGILMDRGRQGQEKRRRLEGMIRAEVMNKGFQVGYVWITLVYQGQFRCVGFLGDLVLSGRIEQGDENEILVGGFFF